MNCKKIQESILTDYIDGQMEEKQIGLLEQHLAHCHACNDFLMTVKKNVVAPFAHVPTVIPDKLLWAQIEQTIKEEQQQHLEKSLKPDFWERLRSAVHIPRPAFALATLVTMIFMIGSTGQLFFSSPVVKINGQDQVEYLSSLVEEPVDLDSNSGNDPQTPIEKVFL